MGACNAEGKARDKPRDPVDGEKIEKRNEIIDIEQPITNTNTNEDNNKLKGPKINQMITEYNISFTNLSSNESDIPIEKKIQGNITLNQFLIDLKLRENADFKIEEILLNLFRKKNDYDNNVNFNELTENFKRRNNEFEKLRKINENLNNEINSLKNRLNATYPQNKFLNEELIDIYSVEKLNILSNKKEIKKKETKQKIPSENNSKIDNRALKDLKEKEKQFEEETKKLKEQNLKDKNLISQLETEINKFKSELKSKESSSLDITSKLSKAENELKKLQDDYIKLLTENEEKKTPKQK